MLKKYVYVNTPNSDFSFPRLVHIHSLFIREGTFVLMYFGIRWFLTEALWRPYLPHQKVKVHICIYVLSSVLKGLCPLTWRNNFFLTRQCMFECVASLFQNCPSLLSLSLIYTIKLYILPITVRFLEHVQVTVTLKHSLRGSLEIYTISPCGTVSPLLTTRQRDRDSKQGFDHWTFMTLFHWGEVR